MITFNCPYCNQNYEMPEVEDGQRLQCAGCDKKFEFSLDLIKPIPPIKEPKNTVHKKKKSAVPRFLFSVVVFILMGFSAFVFVNKDGNIAVESAVVSGPITNHIADVPQDSLTAKSVDPDISANANMVSPPMSDTWPDNIKAAYAQIAEEEKLSSSKSGDRGNIFSGHRKQLLSGVKEMAHPKVNKTGWLSVYRPIAFGVACNYEGGVVVAAAELGKGRLLLFGNAELGAFSVNAESGDMNRLYSNVVSWGLSNPDKQAKIVTNDKEAASWLSANGYINVEIVNAKRSWTKANLEGAKLLVATINRSHPVSEADMEDIKSFVKSGGGAILSCSGFATEWDKLYEINAVLEESGLGFSRAELRWYFVNKKPVWPIRAATRIANSWYYNEYYAEWKGENSFTKKQHSEARYALINHSGVLPWGSLGAYMIWQRNRAAREDVVPTPQGHLSVKSNPVESGVVLWEGNLLHNSVVFNRGAVPSGRLWRHRAALTVGDDCPRIKTKITISPIIKKHGTMRYDTGLYAPPGEKVIITIPDNLVDASLQVYIGHDKTFAKRNLYVMPYQRSIIPISECVTEIGSVHGGLILFYLPESPTALDGATIHVDGAVRAPVFVLGKTTNEEWNKTIKHIKVPWATFISDSVVVIVSRELFNQYGADDPQRYLQIYRDQTYWEEYSVAYEPIRPLRVHHAYYPLGGYSGFPLSFPCLPRYINTESLFAQGQPLSLHEHGHHVQSFFIPGEPGANHSAHFARTKLNLAPPSPFTKIATAKKWIEDQKRGVTSPDGNGQTMRLVEVGNAFGIDAHRNIAARFRKLLRKDVGSWKKVVDLWLKFIADEVGYDFSPWFEFWGLNFSSEAKIYVSIKPKWNKIEVVPRKLLVDQGASITFEHPWKSDFSYDGHIKVAGICQPLHGVLKNNKNGTLTYTPKAGFTGKDLFEYTLQNSYGNKFKNKIDIAVLDESKSPKIQWGQVIVNTEKWTTVALAHKYKSMIVVTTPVEQFGLPPMVNRIRNVSDSSFEILAQRADKGEKNISGIMVQYLVMEEGVYNEEEHGIKMEASKFECAEVDWAAHFGDVENSAILWENPVKDRRHYYAHRWEDHYTKPLLLGQVMSYNDKKWSAFWACAVYRDCYSPDAAGFSAGRHVGEDPDHQREPETIGYIVLDRKNEIVHIGDFRLQLSGATGSSPSSRLAIWDIGKGSPKIMGGLLGSWGLRGFGNNDNETGFWPVFSGPNAFSGSKVKVRVAQDHMHDGRESGAALSMINGEYQLAAFSYMGSRLIANDDVASTKGMESAAVKVLDNDGAAPGRTLKVTAHTHGVHGLVFDNKDGVLIYTPSAEGESDSFTYTVTDGLESKKATVYLHLLKGGFKAKQISNAAGISSLPVVLKSPLLNSLEKQEKAGSLKQYLAVSSSAMTFSKISGPDWLSVSADGRYSMTPPEKGQYEFMFKIESGAGYTPLLLTVNAVKKEQAPQLSDKAALNQKVVSGEKIIISLAKSITDPNGDRFIFKKLSGPKWLTLFDDGMLVGIPAAKDRGINNLAIKVVDFTGLSLNLNIRISVVVAETIPLVADTYVRNGVPASKASKEDGMVIKNDGGLTRESYLRFDYGKTKQFTGNVYLTLTPTMVQKGREIRIRVVAEGVDELNAITMNSRPIGIGEALKFSSNELKVDLPYKVDITGLLKQNLDRNKMITLHIDTTTKNASGINVFATKEHKNADYRPRLQIIP